MSSVSLDLASPCPTRGSELVAGPTHSRPAPRRWSGAIPWPSIPQRIIAFVSKPAVDKSLAVLACIPGAWFAYGCFKAGLMDIPRALFFAEMSLFVLGMLIRRNPVRVSANPSYWAVAFFATYYGFAMPSLLGGGVVIAPLTVCNVLAIMGVWVAIFARLSLGRNIGLVPAQRNIVTGGAYRYVRHPIYTAHFLCSLGFALSCYSLVNVLAIGLGCGLWVVKTFMEESFLSRDPQYAAYMKKNRWRWFPGLA